MALSSQSSRGMGGRYRAARRRGGRRWRWLVLILLLVGGGYWLFSGGGNEANDDAGQQAVDLPANEADSDRERTAVNEQPAAGNGSGNASRHTSSSSSTPSVARAGAAPRINEMTPVSEVRNSAPRSRDTVSSSDKDRSAARESSEARQTQSTPNRSTPSRSSSSPSRSRDTSPAVGIESAEIRKGMDLLADGEVIEGRRVLSAMLFDDRRRLSDSDARAIRETLASVNDRLVFSPEVMSGDPIAEQYEVQSGDLLARIARRYKLTYPFLEQINRIDARRLQVGQSIKLIRGPFHARVSKTTYRMDVFVRQSDGSPIYIRSFPVGLGEDDSTPEGTWVIEPNRKVVSPDWRNPRTGEYYKSDDPENPIGDYWLALEGIDTNTANQRGYGIHGTIDPDSVGQSVSMGCIRLRDDDIEQVYHMLVEGESTVEIIR